MTRSGMTLIELMVALTITGAVTAAGYAAVASLADNRTRLVARADADARAAAVRAALVEWIAHAYLAPDRRGPAFRGLDRRVRDLPDAELAFLTTARTPAGGGPTLVRVFVDRDPRTPQSGLVVELAAWGGPGGTRLEMAPGVAGLSIRYASSLRGDRVWLPSWISSGVLPEAVELTLIPDGGDPDAALLRRPILVRLPGGR